MHTLTSQQTHAHVRTPPKGANLLFYHQMNITDWIVFLWYFIRKSTISMWLMMADMFVLSKLNYRINRHEKDIFNFCFISFVNRVLKSFRLVRFGVFLRFFLFSLIWTHSVPCYIFFFFSLLLLLLLVLYSHLRRAHMLFQCENWTSMYVICDMRVCVCPTDAEWGKAAKRTENIYYFRFPRSVAFFFLSRCYHFLLVSVNVSVV